MGMPTATVRLRGPDGNLYTQSAIGTGPVDAVYKAIDQTVQAPARLLEFVVHAVTAGIDAMGEVTVRIEGLDGAHTMDAQSEVPQPRTFGGYGADTDIIVASAKAYLSALNKVLVATGDYGPTEHVPAEVAVPAD
jgi:2-isopropylmalate synthase